MLDRGMRVMDGITYHFHAGDSPEYVKKALEVGQPEYALIVKGEPEWFWEAFKAQCYVDWHRTEEPGPWLDDLANGCKFTEIEYAEKEKQTDL